MPIIDTFLIISCFCFLCNQISYYIYWFLIISDIKKRKGHQIIFLLYQDTSWDSPDPQAVSSSPKYLISLYSLNWNIRADLTHYDYLHKGSVKIVLTKNKKISSEYFHTTKYLFIYPLFVSFKLIIALF